MGERRGWFYDGLALLASSYVAFLAFLMPISIYSEASSEEAFGFLDLIAKMVFALLMPVIFLPFALITVDPSATLALSLIHLTGQIYLRAFLAVGAGTGFLVGALVFSPGTLLNRPLETALFTLSGMVAGAIYWLIAYRRVDATVTRAAN